MTLLVEDSLTKSGMVCVSPTSSSSAITSGESVIRCINPHMSPRIEECFRHFKTLSIPYFKIAHGK